MPKHTTNMSFQIQDPTWSSSKYLLEEILEICQTANAGGGMFAFASPGGVKLLLNDPDFEAFLSRSPFDLIVGVDAVTNVPALNAIGQSEACHPKLKARVFFDENSNALFHPKFVWLCNESEAFWIVGSGNLTPGGMRGNIEAFAVSRLELDQHMQQIRSWQEWLQHHRQHIFGLDDNVVRDRARQNQGRELSESKVKGVLQEILAETDDGRLKVMAHKSQTDAVLIAELPRASNRWNQANFNIQTFTQFFGASPGATQRIILMHANADGTTGNEELRPSVAVKSRNYRFELEAASGIPYPAVGRPIVVFLRTATRTFIYHLLLPNMAGYATLHSYLYENCGPSGTGVMRYQTTAGVLSLLWPDCPVFLKSD